MQEIATGYESIEQYDKVVLAHGVSPLLFPLNLLHSLTLFALHPRQCHSKPHIPEMFKTAPESFKGIVVHSSKLHGKVYEEIINKSEPIVVVGGGKVTFLLTGLCFDLLQQDVSLLPCRAQRTSLPTLRGWTRRSCRSSARSVNSHLHETLDHH